MSHVSGSPHEEPTTIERLITLERDREPYVLVTLVEALGSTPQDTGAKMIVTAAGRHLGTVGGGNGILLDSRTGSRGSPALQVQSGLVFNHDMQGRGIALI